MGQPMDVNEHELRMRVQRWAQQAAAEYIVNHTTDAHAMAYFAPPDDSLVTYRFLTPVMQEVQQLRVELWLLRQPWWKRWFRR